MTKVISFILFMIFLIASVFCLQEKEIYLEVGYFFFSLFSLLVGLSEHIIESVNNKK